MSTQKKAKVTMSLHTRDYGHIQGLALTVMVDGTPTKRQLMEVGEGVAETPQEVAINLRALADWLDKAGSLR